MQQILPPWNGLIQKKKGGGKSRFFSVRVNKTGEYNFISVKIYPSATFLFRSLVVWFIPEGQRNGQVQGIQRWASTEVCERRIQYLRQFVDLFSQESVNVRFPLPVVYVERVYLSVTKRKKIAIPTPTDKKQIKTCHDTQS